MWKIATGALAFYNFGFMLGPQFDFHGKTGQGAMFTLPAMLFTMYQAYGAQTTLKSMAAMVVIPRVISRG